MTMAMAMTLNARHVFSAVDLALPAGIPPSWLDRQFSAVVTDSRKIIPGCLFVAIPGDLFDGNQFVDQALAQGAFGVLCRKGAHKTQAPGVICEVDDTVAAFRKLAAAWRAGFNLPLALVGGSAGKTTTKELLSAILTGGFGSVLKTQGSNNGFVGIPITLMALLPTHQAAVIEVGIDEPGSMIQHCEIVQPTVSLLTSVGAEHLEKLIDVETVAREEGVAFDFALARADGGSIVVNLDDPHIAPWFAKAPESRRLGFSLTDRPFTPSKNILRGTLHSPDHGPGSELQVEGAGIHARFPLPLPGRHNAANLLGAIATAHAMGLTAQQTLKGLATFVPSEGRSLVRALSRDVDVLCDYYNSQPPSLAAALDLMGDLSAARKATRWACLGDMLELGPDELDFHRAVAPKLLSLGVEHVFLFGERMKALQGELKNQGFMGDLRHFATRDEMGAALAHEVAGPALVLIKGSRGMKMEEVWEKLRADLK